MRIWPWACFALMTHRAIAQVETNGIQRLASQAEQLTASVQAQSLHLLNRLQHQDAKLQQAIGQKDSAFTQEYNTWRQRLTAINQETLKTYIPRLDSLQTALRFLNSSTIATISLSNLSGKLQQATDLGNFLSYRQATLQQQLAKLGMTNKLTSYKQQLYYYKDQISQYKNLLNDPSKLTDKIMTLVRNQPAFQQYFQQHSYLSTLFRLPANSTTNEASGIPAPGLQTREQTTTLVQAKLGKNADLNTALAGSGGGNNNSGSNPIAGGMQQAQQQMDRWKSKLSQYGSGNSSDPMPDFQPNPEHNKTFLRRLQLGWDLQTQNNSYYIPAISTFGFSLGYKFGAKTVAGLGAGYIVGWGEPFNHIRLSSQGASLRSFLNWKLKGSLWLSGGMEMNYLNAFTAIDQLRSFSAWQSSALVGLMKQYKAGNRSGNLQLLFDALYKEHIPQSQPIVFRVGYTLN